MGLVLLYAAAAIILTQRVWVSPTTHWIGGCCDPEQTIWFLGWVPYALTHGLNPLFTTLLNAPDGVNLMWNASTPLLSVLAYPFLVLGGPILAYNALIVMAITVNGLCANFALRRFTDGMIGPILGGAVYALSPFVVAQASTHLNLAFAFAPPLFLVVLDEILVRRRYNPWRLGIALGGISVVQMLVAEEELASSVIAAAVFAAVLAVSRRRDVRDSLRRLGPALAAATVSFLVAGAWPLAVQFLGPQRIVGPVQDVDSFSSDLLNLVLPTQFGLIAPPAATDISRHFSGIDHEAGAYLGFPLLVLLTVVAAQRWGDLRVRVGTLVGVVMLVLSLGPHLHIGGLSTGWPLPWLPLSSLPIVENILPSRLVVFMWLAIAGLVAIIADEAVRLPLQRAATRLAILACTLIVILPAPIAASTTTIPQFFREWEAEGIAPSATVLIAPFFRDGAGADPMVWAAFAGNAVRMPEAYAYVPGADGRPTYGPPATQLSAIMETIQDRGVRLVARGEVRDLVAQDLLDKNMTDVIVGPMSHRDEMVWFFTDLFGRPPDAVDGVLIWRNIDRLGVAPAL